jgi:hypothetical protein
VIDQEKEPSGASAKSYAPWPAWPVSYRAPRREWPRWLATLLAVGNWLVVAQVIMAVVWSLGMTSLSWWWCFVPAYALLVMTLARKEVAVDVDFFAPDPPSAGEKAVTVLLILAQAILLGLKISGAVEWTWWTVLIPAWLVAIPLALVIAHLLLRFIVRFYRALFSFLSL